MEPILLFVRKNANGYYDTVLRGAVREVVLWSGNTAAAAVDGLGTMLGQALQTAGQPAGPIDTPDGMLDALAQNQAYLADALDRIGALEQELALLKGESPDGSDEGDAGPYLQVPRPQPGASDALPAGPGQRQAVRGTGPGRVPAVSGADARAPQNPGSGHVGQQRDRPDAGESAPASSDPGGPSDFVGGHTLKGTPITGRPIRGPYSEG